VIAWRRAARAARTRGSPDTVTAGAVGLLAMVTQRLCRAGKLRDHRADSEHSMVDPGRSSYRTCR
jgi:hypothetical protein